MREADIHFMKTPKPIRKLRKKAWMLYNGKPKMSKGRIRALTYKMVNTGWLIPMRESIGEIQDSPMIASAKEFNNYVEAMSKWSALAGFIMIAANESEAAKF